MTGADWLEDGMVPDGYEVLCVSATVTQCVARRRQLGGPWLYVVLEWNTERGEQLYEMYQHPWPHLSMAMAAMGEEIALGLD